MGVINAKEKFPAQTGLVWVDCEQGSEEWFKSRLGVPTASQFKRIVDTKGNRSSRAIDYVDQLVGEIVDGYTPQRTPKAPEDNDESSPFYWMDRGTFMEDEARNHYMAMTGNEVKEVGFGYNQIIGVGCSPDGLIGEKGGLEIKCPKSKTLNKYLRENRVPPIYYQQVMGSLLVTGREWWDFFCYHPKAKRQLLIRVERDEEYLKKMQEHLEMVVETIALDSCENFKSEEAK